MSGAYDDDAGALFDSAAVSGGEVVLRPWRAGDDLALLQVWGDPANVQQHQDRAMLAEDAERPWRRALVAEDAGVPVAAGVVYASSVHPRRLWQYVETAAAERRRGIGRALVDQMAHTADLLDGPMFLEVRTDNAPAIGLYESFGFFTLATRKQYYQASGADAYSMMRRRKSERDTKGRNT